MAIPVRVLVQIVLVVFIRPVKARERQQLHRHVLDAQRLFHPEKLPGKDLPG